MKRTNAKSIAAMVSAIMAVSALASPVSAFAEDFNYSANNQSKDINVNLAGNEATYTVTIPADVSFGNSFEEKTNEKVRDGK